MPDPTERIPAEHTRLIRALAREIARTLPPESAVQYDDLVSAGNAGLLAARDNYSPEREATFPGYLKLKIRCAMLDALRAVDTLSQHNRRRARLIEEATAALRARLGRDPSPEEISAESGLSFAAMEDATAREVVSIEATADTFAEALEDPAASPEAIAIESEERRHLHARVQELPARERLLVELHYHQGLTLRQIGPLLNVGESRASQLHRAALAKLRAALAQ